MSMLASERCWLVSGRSLVFLLFAVILLYRVEQLSVVNDSARSRSMSSAPFPPFPIERIQNSLPISGWNLNRLSDGIQSIQDPLPTNGNQPLLVILVDFPDREGSFTLQEWQQYFFGFGGFADYFIEASYNNLRYSGSVVGMLDGVPITESTSIAYLRLPRNISFYADGVYGFGEDFPWNNAGVVYDALRIMDSTGFDFSQYADPVSDRVQNLVVIFAGSNYGYTNDPFNSLEATASSLSAGGQVGGYITSGGETIDNFTFCPEKYGEAESEIARLGVCAHEHGHALGMFDLYDRSELSTGTGRFDLMSYGGYGADNHDALPFHPSVFTKEQLGWADPRIVLDDYQIVLLDPAEIEADFIKIFPRGDTDSQEYFLLENRQPLGFDIDWLEAGLCPGLLIWHIDEGIVQDYALLNRVNTRGPEPSYPPHPGVSIVEADGRYDMISSMNFGECSDTWQRFSTWYDLSIPSARLWDRSASRISVTVLDQIGSELVLAITIDYPVFNYQMYLSEIGK